MQQKFVCGGTFHNHALVRVIGFYNIYHQMWALLEQGKALMHCESTSFIYHNDFSIQMKVDEATSRDVFDYLFDVGARKSPLEKKKEIFS